MSQVEAEEYLNKYEDGAFIIRENTTRDFILSVKYENAVQHFRILCDTVGHFFILQVKFNSLNQLVAFHRTASVSRSQTIILRDMDTIQQIAQVKALFDFAAKEEGELNFKRGDIIQVVEKCDPSWWKGVCNGHTGIFPNNYVTQVNCEK